MSRFGGTDWYMAPEIHLGSYDGRLADSWSLGASIYHTVTGRPPCENAVMSDANFRLIIRSQALPIYVEPIVREPLLNLLVLEDLRWTVTELAESDFFRLYHKISPPRFPIDECIVSSDDEY
ncbi:unnamed protein product, partial [Mesorhabditis spiculigera]